MYKKLLFFLLLLLLAAHVLAARAGNTAGEDIVLAEDMWLSGPDLAPDAGGNFVADDDGLTLTAARATAVYTSPALEAPLPFNAVVPRWEADLPDGASLSFYFRSGTRTTWGEWVAVPPSGDMTLPGDELITGDMLVVPAADRVHRRLQFQVSLARGEAPPRLRQLRLTFIDATAGPTTAEAVAQQRGLSQPEATTGYPKPFVVSRSAWCTDPRCNYSDGLAYEPVTHLILHHTVTSSDGDTADTLRAIWYFHAITRDWGDIGYNYLVDTSGVLFEGHLGGDDVIGTHAAGANAGSMALSLIGNFSDVVPPPIMMDAAADLFAWKADQKNIDVYDASSMPDLEWGVPNLMGHRDVYGTTACPGDQAHALLPALRDAVAERIGFTPPHLYYDEWSPESHFSKSALYWYDGPRNCGFNTHAYYTWSVTDTVKSTNWAEWRPEIPVSGRYQLSVYAPYCYTKHADSQGAVYQVHHAHGTDTKTVNQEANLGIWVSLGEYDFAAGTESWVRLTDLTTTDSGRGVWFDAIRLLPVAVAPSVLNQQPEASTWWQDAEVTFRWLPVHVQPITSQILEVATDPAFADVILSRTFTNSTSSFSHTFAEDYPALYWRVRMTTSGGTVSSTATQFGLDTRPPSSTVRGVYRYPDGRLLVAWRGQDAGSGVDGYNIEYRAADESAWTTWYASTELTAAFFALPEPGKAYWFRSQAIDGIGRVETLHSGAGDASTAQVYDLKHRILLPGIYR